ncbi:MAG: T9SS type A sorting domain-containing protein [Bacteroidia bacterium]
MKKQLQLTLSILMCSIFVNAQTWQWASSAGKIGRNDYATSTATDANGNVYVVGDFYGTDITFGATTLTNGLTAGGTSDIFVVKYDMYGSVLWAKRIGGAADDLVNSIAIDGSGNAVVTGEYLSNVLSFGGVSLTITTGGFSDIFVAKYDPAGTVMWAKKGGGNGDDGAVGICTDAVGNIFLAGSFNGPSITFGTNTVTKSGSVDALIVKLDLNGAFLWAEHTGGTSSDGEGYGVSADASGNVFFTGFFQSNSISFGSTTLNNAGASDVFIAKYNSGGVLIWAQSGGGTGEDQVNGISTDAAGNAFITGYFLSPSATFGSYNITNPNPSSLNIFVVKYDGAGIAGWANSAGGSGDDDGTSITTDAAGNVYIAGFFNTSISFGSTTLTSSGSDDIFIARYNPAGNAVYAKGAGGAGSDAALGLSVDAYHNAYLAGGFLSVSFPLSATTLINTDAGDTVADMFITKLNSVNGIDDEANAFSAITIYPNPAHGLFTIAVPSGSTEIQISSADGRIVQSKNIKGETNPVFEILDNGVYFIRIKKDNNIITQKLIVNN